MSRSQSKSRIAQALNEDADRKVRGDLDLWPYIRERVSARQAAEHDVAGRDQIRRDHDTWDRTVAAPPDIPFRDRLVRRTLNLRLAGMMPVFLLAAVMAAYMAISGNFATPNGMPDGCTFITKAEAEQYAGRPMEQARWSPSRPQSFACAYNGENESINLLVTDFPSEEEAHNHLHLRRKSMSNVVIGVEIETINAEPVAGVADEAYLLQQSGSISQRTPFWHVLARQGNTYMIVTWMKPGGDPSADLKTLAKVMAERVRAR